MSCIQVNTLEDAQNKIPSTVLPISGLRHDSEGNLTKDALTMIVDGLKSRGIDPTDALQQKNLKSELSTLLCSLNNQYQFLLNELQAKLNANQVITTEFIDIIKDKNVTMQDVLNVSRHLSGIKPFATGSEFIEGWQNSDSVVTLDGFTTTSLQDDMDMLDSKSYVELRKHAVEVTEEKNKVARNYLGLYGFLNLVAVGLLIYVSAS